MSKSYPAPGIADLALLRAKRVEDESHALEARMLDLVGRADAFRRLGFGVVAAGLDFQVGKLSARAARLEAAKRAAGQAHQSSAPPEVAPEDVSVTRSSSLINETLLVSNVVSLHRSGASNDSQAAAGAGDVPADLLSDERARARIAAWREAAQRRIAERQARRWQSPPFFIDWLTINQTHEEGGLPLVEAGCVISWDEDGSVEFQTLKSVQIEGSYSTSISIKCDGYRVWFSGNMSRFGRSNNVWGFDLLECVARANEVLAHYGLPPFTCGQRIHKITNGDTVAVWTGARISRVDVTQNFETGSAENARQYLAWLGTQHANRQAGRVLGDGETVAWGYEKDSNGKTKQSGSYWKCYIKSAELKRHGVEEIEAQLYEHCEAVGLIRFEGTLRTKLLSQIGACYLGQWLEGDAMCEVIKIFEDRAKVLTRAEHSVDDIATSDLRPVVKSTAYQYLQGVDIFGKISRKEMSRATFYRHRDLLLPYGIDISKPRNVSTFAPRVVVINLKPAEAPAWYDYGNKFAA